MFDYSNRLLGGAVIVALLTIWTCWLVTAIEASW